MTQTIVIDAENEEPAPPPTIDARTRRGLLRRAPASLPYLPGLDGLRALAVAVVVLYHAGVSWVPGGFLGVDVFFVVSGYLITALLAREATTTGRVRLRSFWLRRARRLLPALYTAIGGVLVWTLVADPDQLHRLRREIPAALGYVTNWVLIAGNESYFDAVGRPSPLRHLWSLAIEEQFYLVWPIVFLVGLAVLPRRVLTGVIVAGAIASTVWMIVLFEPFTDPSRVYYGTGTRAAGLLVGGALAMWWRPWDEPRPRHDALAARAGAVGGIGLVVAVLTIGEFDTVLYRGGFLAVAVLTALLIVGATARGTMIEAALSNPVLRWIGQRSYAIYLWHWPVVVFTRPNADVTIDGLPLFAYRVGVTLILAALSYRLIEVPYRLGKNRWAASRPLFAPPPTGVRRLRSTVPFMALTVLLVAVPLLARPPEKATAEELLSTASTIVPTTAPAPTPPDAAPGASSTTAPPSADPPPAAVEITDVLVIGDSVPLGAGPALVQALGAGTAVDADVGRQGPDGAGVVRRWIEDGWVGDALVVHLGNNGPVSPSHLDEIVTAAGARKVVLVTVRVPRPWESASNEQIRAAAGRHANVSLLDWNAHSSGQRVWFADDGIHLTPSGARAYALLVTAAVRS